MPKLTAKQALFVAEYLKDLNATQAARRAGYSEKRAEITGPELLRKPHIAVQVAVAKEAQLNRVRVDADEILRELQRFALADPLEAVTDEGALKALKDMPVGIRRAIASIEVEELFEGRGDDREQVGVLRKVKFWDKPRGLELLGKHLALFTEKHEHSGPGGSALSVTVNLKRTVKEAQDTALLDELCMVIDTDREDILMHVKDLIATVHRLTGK